MTMKMSGMKIAYALSCFDVEHSGVFKKIRDQVNQWTSLGHTVQLFVITDQESKIHWQKIDPHSVILIDTNLKSKIMNRLKLIPEALKISPSVVYLRDIFPLRIPKCASPIIIEVQTLVGSELRIRSKLRSRIFQLGKKFHYRHLAGAIFPTNELMRLNEFELSSTLPKIVIGNGISLNHVEILPPRPQGKPSLLFLGTPNQSWHGVSELIEFARLNPDIGVELVGESGISALPNLRFHGFLRSDEYRQLAIECVAAVGTLNLSAKHMTEASPLKVREYLALGLPVIVKYIDVDLDPESDFVLQLPLDGRVMGDFSAEIQSFLDYWSNKRVLRSKVRNLDVAVKEKIRLGFFDEVSGKYPKKNSWKDKYEFGI